MPLGVNKFAKLFLTEGIVVSISLSLKHCSIIIKSNKVLLLNILKTSS
jgi:hypothetical protein